MLELYSNNEHKSIFCNDLSVGSMVEANQHIIIHNGEGILLDPGGHKIYTRLFAQLSSHLTISGLKYIFFSHQDPDIIAATNGWLMVTDANALLSALWMRFIPHFGVDELVVGRIKPIPDEGMVVKVGGVGLKLIPAHFLHSPGNFQLYDPISKILYTGDLGASLGTDDPFVKDFDAHIPAMEGFHRRYLPSSKPLKMWAKTVRQLDIEIIAPQHGAMMAGRENVDRFISWIEHLDGVGYELMGDSFPIPE
ncbi:MAG: MBL fold metallo-hydrolase [Pseudomonadota bacterium]